MGFSSLDPERGLDKFAANVIRQAAKRLVGKYGYLPDDREDIEQELAAELIARFPKWDPTKGARTTYTTAVLKYKIANMVRDRRAQRRNQARSPQSLDAATINVGDEAVSLAQAITDAAKHKHTGQVRRNKSTLWELRHDLRMGMSKLTVKQRNLCRLLMHGRTITDAAKALGISRVTASKRVRQILERFQDVGLSDFL